MFLTYAAVKASTKPPYSPHISWSLWIVIENVFRCYVMRSRCGHVRIRQKGRDNRDTLKSERHLWPRSVVHDRKREARGGKEIAGNLLQLDRCENARVTLYAPSSSITNNGLPRTFTCVLWPCQGSCEVKTYGNFLSPCNNNNNNTERGENSYIRTGEIGSWYYTGRGCLVIIRYIHRYEGWWYETPRINTSNDSIFPYIPFNSVR